MNTPEIRLTVEPCPFCDISAEVRNTDGDEYAICVNTECELYGIYVLLEAWENRPSAAIRRELQDLRDLHRWRDMTEPVPARGRVIVLTLHQGEWWDRTLGVAALDAGLLTHPESFTHSVWQPIIYPDPARGA